MTPRISQKGCSRTAWRSRSPGSRSPRRDIKGCTGASDQGRLSNRRRAVDVKRLDRLKPPGLALLALLLRPDDGFPVRRQDQARAGIADFSPFAPGLVAIE